ncbi:MAG: hypothetical protein ACRDAM_22275, partial [Casimicrobium sp.]
RSRTCTLALACLTTLLVSACEAQPSPNATPQNKSSSLLDKVSTAITGKQRYSEPALVGKIIDAQTKQPIQGVMIYGHYATSQGSFGGGSKPGEHVKSFLVQTDTNGVFTLEAWDTGDRKVSGQPGGHFPLVGFYKPGYEFGYEFLGSVARWRPRSRTEGAVAEKTDNRIDWTKFPHQMKPITSELDRYNALNDSGYPIMMVRECGWEVYAPLLLAQHRELKDWIARVVPAEHRDSEGYGRSSWGHPDPMIRGYSGRSFVDQLKQQYRNNPASWKCSNPNDIFSK